MKLLWSLWLQEQLHDLTALLEDNVEIEHECTQDGEEAIFHFICWKCSWTCSCQFWCFRRKSFELIKSPLVKTAFPFFFPSLEAQFECSTLLHKPHIVKNSRMKVGVDPCLFLLARPGRSLGKKNNELDELDRGHDLINWRDLCLRILFHNFWMT